MINFFLYVKISLKDIYYITNKIREVNFMTAEILCVGTELLLGDIVNTNAAFLAKELAALGINVFHQTVVGDNSKRLKTSLDEALDRCDLVVTTGGLGPTCDDLTKETAAEYFSLPMEENEEALQHIVEYFKKINRPMVESNRKQAMIPKGAEVLKNTCGTAPGIFIKKDNKLLALLPGPPREMETMFKQELSPRLQKLTGKTLVSKTVHIFNLGESFVESRLRDLMNSLKNPTLAPYAKEGEVQLRITALADTTDEGNKMIEPVLAQVKEIIGEENIYGIDVGNLQTALVRSLAEKGLKIAVAESITGGLVAKRITEVSGSSAVFECGICSYSNKIKAQLLGVSEDTLAEYSEYSPETAAEMAKGVRKISGADIAVATTGIAGPNGGSEEKPVGLVYVAVDSENYNKVIKLNLSKGLDEERELIRYLASSHALYLALTAIEKL